MPLPWKENMPAAGLAIGCFINGFFTTNSLVDYSVDLWASAGGTSRLSFATAFYAWRAEAPIVGIIFMMLLPTLPFMLFDVAKSACQTVFGWRQASSLRHAGDLCQFACFSFLFPYIITTMIPAQSALMELNGTCGVGARKPALDACDAALNALLVPHLVVLLLNVLLLCCDIAKYNGNCADAAFAAAASSYKAKAA